MLTERLNDSVACAIALFITATLSAAQKRPSPASQQAERDFSQNCSICHGANASGTERGPSLVNNRRLRAMSEKSILTTIQQGTSGGMPSFSWLPKGEQQLLAKFVRSLNATAYENPPQGDVASGRQFFFGKGGCSSCHMVMGEGGTNGPDLSRIGRQLTLPELERALSQPASANVPGYDVVNVRLRDGRALRGFARTESNHDLVLETFDGQFHSLSDQECMQITPEKTPLMPRLQASDEERRDLLAYLSRLGGVASGALATKPQSADRAQIEEISHPKPGDWPTYYGRLNGNRYSLLRQINRQTVSRLKLAWIYSIPHVGLEVTPLVIDGVMYVTGPNQVDALDARTGAEIWHYQRPRTPSGIAGDALKGTNRGVAVLGDRVFYITDNAHLICLNRLTGALMWDVDMPDTPQHYGGTEAPLVVGNLVIAGVAGADDGIRGFVAAYRAATGERVWRFWTVPLPGQPGSATWADDSSRLGGGSTWLTGTYDSETGLLFWPIGNPFPDTDGDHRAGDNLYTDCIAALDPQTGKLRWYFQFTPHDLHDWDAEEPPVLVDTVFHGRERELLLQANRNGFFYVLDRTNGKLLLATPFVHKLSWASGVGPDGRPELLAGYVPSAQGTRACPAVRGATNWMSTSFDPATRLFYVMSVEGCSIYFKRANGSGFGWDPKNPPKSYLRALNIQTGKVAWQIPQVAPGYDYSGVLSTAGHLVFYGETSGDFAAVDAKTGSALWHFDAHQHIAASPMTYEVDGRQYVAIAAGSNILSFTLPGPR